MGKVSKNYLSKNLVGSFRGLPGVLRARKYTAKESVRKELEAIPAYTLFKPAKQIFQRRLTRVYFNNFQWSIDLMTMINLAQYNKQIKYVLISIDNFSKYLRTAFLKNKVAGTVLQALKQMFK